MAHARLRSLSGAELRQLQNKLRDLSLSARVHQRYRIVSEVLKGHSVTETAERVGCHFTVAYDWVGRFNQSGFKTFEQVPNPRVRPPMQASDELHLELRGGGSQVLAEEVRDGEHRGTAGADAGAC
jgi:transposase